jgi:hypothetical protein
MNQRILVPSRTDDELPICQLPIEQPLTDAVNELDQSAYPTKQAIHNFTNIRMCKQNTLAPCDPWRRAAFSIYCSLKEGPQLRQG